jgi:anti-sigma factor RsiW
MRDDHIIKMLETRAVSRLSEAEAAIIESHTALCPECLRAYKAARISADLVRARASETVEASPFFKTRVMAALKEKQLSPEPPALVRMWTAARALVSTMAAIVVVLLGLTIFSYSPDSQVEPPEQTAGVSIYAPEYILFDEDETANDALQYDQVLATFYEAGDVDGQ